MHGTELGKEFRAHWQGSAARLCFYLLQVLQGARRNEAAIFTHGGDMLLKVADLSLSRSLSRSLSLSSRRQQAGQC
ncbi:hypothetical protein BA896_012925 [Janthinobacterium lividum]|uniref:Uncharacterized protein n=1 Tax=Janthinobacterium lividum TaxID=29581 RepID=A0A1E8PVE2_9BURK|nr:hypothetical protein BA896_012925 [Janthinobacterium lividum]